MIGCAVTADLRRYEAEQDRLQELERAYEQAVACFIADLKADPLRFALAFDEWQEDGHSSPTLWALVLGKCDEREREKLLQAICEHAADDQVGDFDEWCNKQGR